MASPVAQAELVSLPHQCCGVMGAWNGMNLALGFIREHQGNGAEPEAGAVCRWTDHSQHLRSWGFAGGEARAGSRRVLVPRGAANLLGWLLEMNQPPTLLLANCSFVRVMLRAHLVLPHVLERIWVHSPSVFCRQNFFLAPAIPWVGPTGTEQP